MRAVAYCLGLVVIAKSVLIGSLFAAQNTARPPEKSQHQDLIFFAIDGPVFLRVHLKIDQKSIRQLRRSYAEKMFHSLDQNRDKSVDRKEASNQTVMRRLLANSRTSQEAWEKIDRDPNDGKISLEELDNFFDEFIGPPLDIVSNLPVAEQQSLLFKKIDLNNDGQISKEEPSESRKLLTRFDLDGDEAISAEELEPFQFPNQFNQPNQQNSNIDLPLLSLSSEGDQEAVSKELLQRYGDSKDDLKSSRIPIETIGIPPQEIKRYDLDSDGFLNRLELSKFLEQPSLHGELTAQLFSRRRATLSVKIHDPSRIKITENDRSDRISLNVREINLQLRAKLTQTASRDSRTFYLLQFRRIDNDKNKYLDESEFAGLGLPGANFADVDQDGDKMVFLKELASFIDQGSFFEQSRVNLLVARQGKSLFELLDRNFDRRLGPREFRQAFRQLTPLDLNQDGMLAAGELAGRYRLTFEVDKPELFENLFSANQQQSRVPRVMAAVDGPVWFQKMDLNRDGDVSRREFLGPLELFTKIDLDSDGLIDSQEATQAE